MRNLSLFIDESGQANPKAPNSGVYILSGCMVDNDTRNELEILANQVKFKYWDRTDIVFHSREIDRKEGEFNILKDPVVQRSFEKNLFRLLNHGGYKTFFVLVDLNKAKSKNWNEEKVYKETTNIMMRNFILALLSEGNCRGRVVIESATSKKDFYFHKAASYFLSGGLPQVKVSYKKVQNILTEISYVTKKNHDIEEQIADLLAYGARLKFEKRTPNNNYEKNILKLVNSKRFIMHPNTGNKKKKYQSLIESFKILP